MQHSGQRMADRKRSESLGIRRSRLAAASPNSGRVSVDQAAQSGAVACDGCSQPWGEDLRLVPRLLGKIYVVPWDEAIMALFD